MDRQIWHQIRDAVISADRSLPRCGRRGRYSDRLIVALHFWCVWHDRPRLWMRDRLHFSTLFRPRVLPSYSQFCRRLASPRVIAMIRHVNTRLAGVDGEVDPAGQGDRVGSFDGKPLLVSDNSRDPDARNGRGAGTFRRGYKLHAWGTQDQRVRAVAITALNAGEPTVAREQLVSQLPPHTLTLADGNYDSDKLYRSMDEAGHRLLTPLKGISRTPRHLAKMSAGRLGAIEQWQSQPTRCRAVLRLRGTIERTFANLSNFGGGLTHLPPWVRTLRRVELWVLAKLAIYHARRNARTAAA